MNNKGGGVIRHPLLKEILYLSIIILTNLIMKKSLLVLSFAALAGMASAQTEVVMATSESLEAAGLSGTKTDIEGDVVFAEGAVGSIATAYKDSWGSTKIYKNYRNVKVGDSDVIALGDGAVGNTNPTFVSYESGVMSGGAVFKIHSNKTGYMTVFTKINPKKQYLVFEGTANHLGYTLGYANADNMIHYCTPNYGNDSDFAGCIDWAAADINKYFITAQKQQKDENGQLLWLDKDGNIVAGERPVWTDAEGNEKKGTAVMEDIPGEHKPQFPYLVAGMESAPGESTGFLTFSVYEDTDYYFSALGSKAACGGFVFTEEEPTVVFEAVTDADGNVTAPERVFPALGIIGSVNGVEGVAAAEDANAPIYNMMGVRVNADAKGILIQNGKKFIRK